MAGVGSCNYGGTCNWPGLTIITTIDLLAGASYAVLLSQKMVQDYSPEEEDVLEMSVNK